MKKINFEALNSHLRPDRYASEWLPDGKRVGSEWIARNPLRADNKAGSFTINLSTGKWADFATDDKGGDMVSLYAYLFTNNDQSKAVKELCDLLGVTVSDEPEKNNVTNIKDQQPQPIIPAPADAPSPNFRHYKHGDPSKVWPYYDAKGRLLMFVCRFDHPDHRKDILPYSYCVHPDGSKRWTWRGITGTDRRLIYGLDRLAALPDADVLVVEGEKTADAAQQIVGKSFAVISWLGGTATADRLNLKPLKGRRIILWPDFDAQKYKDSHELAGQIKPLHEQPGVKAMIEIAKRTLDICSSVRLVKYDLESVSNSGWDLADGYDEGWELEAVIDYIKDNSGDPAKILSTNTQPVQDNDPDADIRPLSAELNAYNFPHLNGSMAPVNSFENMQFLLSGYGVKPRYNVMSKEVEIQIPGRRHSQDNHMSNCISILTSLCARNRMPRTNLEDYILLIADENQRNPAIEWIDSKPWDGVDRLRELTNSLDPVDYELAYLLIRRWMVGAVQAAFDDNGMAMQGLLVLQGAQGLGKTTWFWQLANNDRLLGKEGVLLNPTDKDSVKLAISYWLVELGELDATFRKSDIAALKSFMTRDRDELRMPYARASSKFPRRTAYVATVNDGLYLRDETGNRRFWTIKCGRMLNCFHGIDVQQCWAQAKQLWKSGERHSLSPEESDMLNEANLDHTEVSPIEELILSKMDWQDTSGFGWSDMSATEVLVSIGYDKPQRAQTREASNILRKLTGGEPKRLRDRRVFNVPPKHLSRGETAF